MPEDEDELEKSDAEDSASSAGIELQELIADTAVVKPTGMLMPGASEIVRIPPSLFGIARVIEEQQQRMASQAARVFQPWLNSAVFDQARMIDSIVPSTLRGAELSSTAWLADTVSAQSALAGWRHSLISEDRARSLAATALGLDSLAKSFAVDLARYTSVASFLADTSIRLSTADLFTSVLSQPPSFQLSRYLTRLPASPSTRQLKIGVRASHSIAGLVGIETTTVKTDDDDALAQAIGMVDVQVVKPWVDGPAKARAEMLVRVMEFDGTVPDLLDGAWEDVDRAGPVGNVRIATLAVEALDRTLRGMAPDTAVRVWLTEQKRPADELRNGRPTLTLRARYALRNRRGDRELVMSEIDSVVAQVPALRSRLEAGKHASAGTLMALRAHLVSTEALLIQLTLD